MSQEPDIPRATPTVPEKPTCVPAISIVGIALGGLTLLGRLVVVVILIVLLTLMRGMPDVTNSTAGYYAYQIASSLVFAGFAVLLVTASIACLRLREWGRVWLIRYAIAYPIAMVLELICTVITSTHDANDLHAALGQNATTTATTAPTMNIPHGAGLLIGEETLVMLLLLILPAVILVFLRRPAVKAFFKS